MSHELNDLYNKIVEVSNVIHKNTTMSLALKDLCQDRQAGMVTIEDLEHLRIKTFPLYNCRERGVCLAVNVDVSKPCTLLIFFAPNRITDSLFVWWEEVDKLFLNAPTVDDFSEHSYEHQIELFGEDFIKAAKFICRKIGEFHRVRMRENM